MSKAPTGFAARLDAAIKASGMSVPAVAAAIGVGGGYLYKLLGRTEGKRIESPNLDRVAELARHLKVSPSWLAFGEGAMQEEGASGSAHADAAFFAQRVMHVRPEAIELATARYKDVADELSSHEWVAVMELEERRLSRTEIAKLSLERETLHRKLADEERRKRRRGGAA